MKEHLLWQLLVIGASLLASVLGSLLAYAIFGNKKPAAKKKRQRREREDDEDENYSTRNAPKGTAALVFWILAALGCGGLMLLFGISLVALFIQSVILDPGPGGGGPPPPRVVNPVPPVAEDLGPKEKLTEIAGGVFDPTFKDQAPADGVLIGFDVGLGHAFGVELVKAIQPKYRTPQGEAVGRKYGSDFAKIVSVKAKPGYAVGAINVKAGMVVNGFSVTFMRVKGAALDPADAYSSQWIGDKTGGNPPVILTGEGTRIVGIIGKRNVEDCTGLGLLKK